MFFFKFLIGNIVLNIEYKSVRSYIKCFASACFAAKLTN